MAGKGGKEDKSGRVGPLEVREKVKRSWFEREDVAKKTGLGERRQENKGGGGGKKLVFEVIPPGQPRGEKAFCTVLK